MKEPTEKEYLHKMAAYCSGAERCEQDIRKKIAALPTEAQNRILEQLKKEGFINDRRYCRSFINDKSRFNRWGRVKIAYELRMKGLSPAVIEEGLDTIDADEYLRVLRTLLKDKQRSMKSGNNRNDYAKLFRFAASRGFESNLIAQILKETSNADDDIFGME